MSVNYDLHSYEAKRLLSPVESPSLFEQEDSTMPNELEVSEATRKGLHQAQFASVDGSLKNGQLHRASSDLSMYTLPMRRQSLRTPGVATRGPPPHPQSGACPELRLSRPETPDQSRRNSLMIDDYESDGESYLELPPRLRDSTQPRVLTPSDDDYKQQLGAFKLGSLRIVNGAASPSPTQSPLERKSARAARGSSPSKAPKQESYFLRPSVPPKRDEELGGEEKKNKTHRAERNSAPVPGSSASKATEMSFTEYTTPKIDPTVESPTPRFDLPATFLSDLTFTSKDLDLDQQLAPSDLNRLTSSGLKTTSKHTAEQDQLFEYEDQGSDIFVPGPEVLSIRDDPSAKSSVLQRQKADLTQKCLRVVSQADSGFVSSPTSDGGSTNRSSGGSAVSRLTKADSGYSSNVSLRSFKGASNHDSLIGRPPVPDKDLPPRRNEVLATNSAGPIPGVYLEDTRAHLSETQAEDDIPPPVPEKDFVPRSPMDKTTSADRCGRDGRKTHPGFPEPQVGGRPRQFPTPSPIPSQVTSDSGLALLPSKVMSPKSPASNTQARSPKSPHSQTISPTMPAEKPRKAGRIRRLLSASKLRSRNSRAEFAVYSNSATLDPAQIPHPPKAVEEKLAQHTSLFPGGSKRLALKTKESKDTLMTIFSVGWVNTQESDAPSARREKNRKEKKDRIARSIPSVIGIPSRSSSLAGHTNEPLVERPSLHGAPLHNRATVHGATTSSHDLPPQVLDTTPVAVASECDAYFSGKQAASVGRTMSMTAYVERDLHMRVAAQRRASSYINLHGQYEAESPVFSPEYYQVRTMSMTSRPPQPRPSSIPAAQSQREALSRKTSREGLVSYPPAMPSPQELALSDQQQLLPSRPSSSASIRSQPHGLFATQIPPYSPQILKRSSSSSGMPQWRQSHSRTGSFSSYSDYGGYAASIAGYPSSTSGFGPPTRPSSSQGYRTMSLRQPPSLKHRRSDDSIGRRNSMIESGPGYYERQKMALYREMYGGHNPNNPAYNNGFYGGNRYGPDPWAHRAVDRMSYGPSPFPWDQYGQHGPMQGRYPSYVPRDRSRSRSRSNSSRFSNPPYRVLHSYNSPAYRGVPIWG